MERNITKDVSLLKMFPRGGQVVQLISVKLEHMSTEGIATAPDDVDIPEQERVKDWLPRGKREHNDLLWNVASKE